MKKAMSEQTLMYVLLFIVAMLVVGFIALKIVDVLTSQGDTESCRLSVLAADKSPVETSLQCSRKQVVLYPNYYTVDGDTQQYSSEDYATAVKYVFANEMKECWYKMGEGKLNVFSSLGFSAMKIKKGCLVCSHISFEEPTINDIGNLYEYLQDTKIPTTLTTFQDTTYFDYMYSSPKEKLGGRGNILVAGFFGLSTGFYDVWADTINTNVWIYNNNQLNTAPLTTTQDYNIYFVSLYNDVTDKDIVNGILVYSSDNKNQPACEYIYS
jgi:hypothetical protein